jgi:molecular chaperone HscB
VATDDHFSLFGLPNAYALDEAELSAAWRDVAARVHPDRFATASAPERRVAMQWSARANEAYRVLRDPLARARYMCEQAGIDLQTETNTAMSPGFLMQQMTWREQLDDARDQQSGAAFDALDVDLRAAQAELSNSIAVLIDRKQDFTQAGERVREWMFIQRIAQSLADHRPH